MFTFEGHCPHCYSDRGFLAFGCSSYLIGQYDYSRCSPQERERLALRHKENPPVEFSLAGTCLHCKQPVVATCKASLKDRREIQDCIGKFDLTTRLTVEVCALFPAPTPPYSHPSLPEKVRDSFVDLQKMIQEGKQPHFIIFGCRAVLEAAVRALGGEGKTLHERVEDLYSAGVITSSLKDWASIIRRVGNEAAHQMEGTPEDAREMVAFVKVFLQFTFELPAVIQAARTR